MSCQEIVSSFKEEEGFLYCKNEGLSDLFDAWSRGQPNRIPPEYNDLARLHKTARDRKVFTILEFGVGFSTLVMADAIKKNRQEWLALEEKPMVRCSSMFEVHSVDSSEHWLNATKKLIPAELTPFIKPHYSACRAGTFHDRVCHYYESLPNIVPDMIYLDGPDPKTVVGSLNGIAWDNPDRVVMAADILKVEPLLLPGCIIMVDGRSANARFLTAHLYRNWEIAHSPSTDLTVLELMEPPLGKTNEATLHYCLGNKFHADQKKG